MSYGIWDEIMLGMGSSTDHLKKISNLFNLSSNNLNTPNFDVSNVKLNLNLYKAFE